MSGSGLRSSLSADDVGSSANKPGKISAEFISKFESDSAIGGSTGAIHVPQRLSHASSSGMGSSSASHEHLQSIKPHVKISEPVATRSDEATNEKKRKWKWNPLKKMRKFFSRKKSSRRTKSAEDLRTESYRAKSESDESLDKRREKLSPVVRTSTMPSSIKVPVVRELKERHTSNNYDLRTNDSFTTKASSLPVLTSTELPSREYQNIEEAGVSFESNPDSSSLEGLQAARDKIKAAPKRRRPPSRKRTESGTSNASLDSPVRTGQKTPHRRSKTDPKDLSRDRLNDSGSLSDILNNTIFEEDSSKSPPSSAKENSKDDQKKAMDEITARANKALSRTSGSTKRVEQPKNTEVEKVEVKKTEVKKPEVKKPEMTNLQPKKPEVTKPEAAKPEVKTKPVKKDDEIKVQERKPELSGSTSSSSRTSEVQRNSKRFSLDESTKKSFTDSVLSSKSDSDMLKAEFTTLLQSDPSDSLWNEPEPQTSTAKEETAKPVVKRKTSQDKSTQITTTPFKRGKSWSNNHISKMIEKQDKENEQKESSKDVANDMEEEDNTFSKNKDFRFSRTKSWSYGMKTGELVKATEILQSTPNKPQAVSSENVQNEPTWVAKANRVSKRMSQIMQDDNSENQASEPTKPETASVGTPSKPKFTIGTEATTTYNSPKPAPAPKSTGAPKPAPAPKSTGAPKPASALKSSGVPKSAPAPKSIGAPKPTPAPQSPGPPKSAPVSKPSGASKPAPAPKSSGTPKPAPAPKTTSTPKPSSAPNPSSFVRSSASLPLIVGTTPNNSDTKPTTVRNDTPAKKQAAVESKITVQQTARSSFNNVKIEKCIVCGTTVYQMEKCKFDDSVLHRNCIKCTVCKRHLTVGNFVMTESKIYCKPHSQSVVAVST